MSKTNHGHRPQHDKLTLGEVDDAGGVVDDSEAQGNQGINAATGDTRDKKLWELVPDHHKKVSKVAQGSRRKAQGN